MRVPVDGLMETYKYFPLGVGSSVSTTIIYHRRKTFQVIEIHTEKGEWRGEEGEERYYQKGCRIFNYGNEVGGSR